MITLESGTHVFEVAMQIIFFTYIFYVYLFIKLLCAKIVIV